VVVSTTLIIPYDDIWSYLTIIGPATIINYYFGFFLASLRLNSIWNEKRQALAF